MQVAIVLILLVLAIIFFALETISVDLITLGLLSLLVLMRILTPAEAFSGFSSDILIFLSAIFVISGALIRTGVLDTIGQFIYQKAGGSYRKLLLLITVCVSCVSPFLHNTITTAVFIPPVVGIARNLRLSASKLLMPVAFASMLAGTCTLIGTSTNIAASAMLQQYGLKAFGLFEFTPIGIVVLAVGALYMALFANRLLPDHDDKPSEEYHVKEYLTEVSLKSESHLVGKEVREAKIGNDMDLIILGIIRNGKTILAPEGNERLQEKDTLLLKSDIEGIARIKGTNSLEIKADMKPEESNLESENVKLVEVMLMPGSDFIGKSLKEIDFRHKYTATVLALYRHGETVVQKVGRVNLQFGDVLLVQGSEYHINQLRQEPDIWILGDVSHYLFKKSKGLYVMSFFVIALALGTLNVMPLSIATLLAALLTVLTRCISIEEAYKSIDWRLLILIAGMTAYGTAMSKTGADRFLANQVVGLLGRYGASAVMAGFFLLTVVLTQPLSNAAAALVILPVAISTAQVLHVNPRTFAMAVTLAASFSFITPFEPACILVYNAGKYKFWDFIRFGTPLTLILFPIVMLLLPLFWPMK